MGDLTGIQRAAPDERLPRYQRIRDSIADSILRGDWTAGQSIPTEGELSRSHGVAIGTVRKAIDLLESEGLVERSQGKGTFVRRARFDRSLFRFFRLLGPDGEKLDPRSRLLSREKVKPPHNIAEDLNLAHSNKAIKLTRLRFASESPLLYEEIWLRLSQFEPILTLPESELGPLLYPAYERHFGVVIARASETLTIELSSAEVASHLGIKVRDPVVRIERRALDHAGAPVELRISYGPAATFRYQIEVR